MQMTCQDFEVLSGAYALGALTPQEYREAKEHLEQCSNCRAVVKELEGVVDWLPLAVPLVEPAADLKERVLAHIKAEGGLAVKDNQDTQPVSIAMLSHSKSVMQPQRSTIRQRRGRSSRRWGWSRALVAAAAVLLVLVLGGMITWNVNLQQRLSAVPPPVKPTIPAQVQAEHYTVQGTGVAAGAMGQVTCYEKDGVCVLVMKGLPTLNGKQLYQGWLLQGKQPTSVGVLNVEDGVGTVGFVGNGHGYDAAAVSREPGPAASQQAPKGPIVAVGSLNKPTSS